MGDTEETYKPDWDEHPFEPGTYLFPVAVLTCAFADTETTKPYLDLGARIESSDTQHEFEGKEFSFKVYLTRKAERWCRYFLKKFEYSEELLARQPPEISKSAIVGLKGLLLVEVKEDEQSGFLNFDVQGFGHYSGDKDLEDKFKKMTTGEETMEMPTEAREQEVDIRADVKEEPSNVGQADDPFSALEGM